MESNLRSNLLNMKTNFIYFIAYLALISSCSKDADPLDFKVAEEQVLDYQSGRNDFSLLLHGKVREFIVHVPQDYNGISAVPLFFMLHGSSGTGEKFWNITNWKSKAEEENFIAVFPTALEYPIAEHNGRLTTKWSSTGLITEIVPGTTIVDDLPFFESMIDQLEKTFNLDRSRYYISGFSNGGGFVKSRIMIEMNQVFAAASAAGGLGYPRSYIPVEPRYLPFFNIVGSLDTKVLVQADGISEVPLSADDLLSNQVFNQNINNVLNTLKVEDIYSESPNKPAYNVITFSDSKVGQNTEYVLQIINDMGHSYPNGKNNPFEIDAVDLLWPWFMKFQNRTD